MAFERAGAVLARILQHDGPHPEGADDVWTRSAIVCCEGCPAWSMDRRVIASHRVHCDTFADVVLRPYYEQVEAQGA